MTTQQPQMVQQLQMVQQPQIVQQPQMFQQPQPVLTPQIQSMNMQPNYNQQMVQQPMYGNQQMQGMYGQYTQPNQMYGQNYMQTQFPQQYYPQQMGGYQQPYVQMNQPQVQHAQIQSHVQPQISQQISLQSEKKPRPNFKFGVENEDESEHFEDCKTVAARSFSGFCCLNSFSDSRNTCTSTLQYFKTRCSTSSPFCIRDI